MSDTSDQPETNSVGAMIEDDIELNRYERARKKVRELKKFYGHVAVYLVVNAFLHIIDFLDGADYWAFWPLLGWGVLVLLQGANVYQVLPFNRPEWEEKKIREYMEREKPKEDS